MLFALSIAIAWFMLAFLAVALVRNATQTAVIDHFNSDARDAGDHTLIASTHWVNLDLTELRFLQLVEL